MSQTILIDTGQLVALINRKELIKGSTILTLDSDFRIYRKNKNELIDLLIPANL